MKPAPGEISSCFQKAVGAILLGIAMFSFSDSAGAGDNKNGEACGWYIILACHKEPWAAQFSLDKLGGSGVGGGAGTAILKTGDYAGMRSGYFCVADGPYRSKQTAGEVAWIEAVPTAYLRRGCRK